MSHVLDRFLTFCPYHLVHPNPNIFLYANIIFTLTHLFLSLPLISHIFQLKETHLKSRYRITQDKDSTLERNIECYFTDI